jgi:hypothetical protein
VLKISESTLIGTGVEVMCTFRLVALKPIKRIFLVCLATLLTRLQFLFWMDIFVCGIRYDNDCNLKQDNQY